MKKLARYGVSLGTAAVLIAAAFAPAMAASTSITDPAGDTPDIRRLTLNNKNPELTFKQKYANIEYVQVDTFYIKWGAEKHYYVNLGNYDGDPALERRLTLVNGD